MIFPQPDSIPAPVVTRPKTLRGFEPGWKQRFQGAEFDYDRAPVMSLWERFLLWLQQWWQSLFGTDAPAAVYAVSLLLKLLLAATIICLAVWLVRTMLKKRPVAAVSFADAPLAETLQRTDFASDIEKAKQSGDLRLSIRLYYLWLLNRLDVRERIAYEPEKTNADYMRELSSDEISEDFSYLSYLYNYIWYGAFDPDPEDFEKAEKAYLGTLKTLR